MDVKYNHPSIQLYIMTLKTLEGSINLEDEADTSNSNGNSNSNSKMVEDEGDDELPTEPHDGSLSEWEARRYGSMAARLLRDIKIT